MRTEDVNVQFRENVNQNGVTSQAIELLKMLCAISGNAHVEISDAVRSTYTQAKTMYDNCVNLGTQSQYKLYDRNGDKVIDVFVEERKKKTDKATIISLMQAKIVAVGPSKVSKHLVDPSIMNVFDIPFKSIANKEEFRKALNRCTPYPISRYLDESNNNCFHIEMKLADVQGFFRTREYEQLLHEMNMALA